MYYALLKYDTSIIEEPEIIGLFADIKKAEEKLYSVFGKSITEYCAEDPSMVSEIANLGEIRWNENNIVTYLYDSVIEYYILPVEEDKIFE